MARVSIFLIVVVLISGTVGCIAPPPAQYNLNISSTEGGSVTTPGESGPYTYDEGTVVNLVAVEAEQGYQFVNWTGDVGAIANVNGARTTITMSGDYSITANFVRIYSLTISSSVGGSVTGPGEGAFPYRAGSVVNLVAAADSGYHFVNWTGDVGTIADVASAIASITMDSSHIISANFGIDLYFDTDAWAVLDGQGTLPPEERSPRVFFQIRTNIVMDRVRVDMPDGGSVIVPAYNDLSSPDVDQITTFRFLTYVTGMPIADGEYVFTGLDTDGEPVPEARNTDVWLGVEPPDPPTNVRAEMIEDGVLVTWDESAVVPGSFEPAAEPQLGFYMLQIFRAETGSGVYDWYGAPFISVCSYMIPRDRADFVEGRDWGVSLGEMHDGTYHIACQVNSVAPGGSLGKGYEYSCFDPGQTIIFTIQNGEIAIE